MESVTKPEGYPYLKFTCITERAQYNKEDDREETYYEAHPAIIDFNKIDPIYWYRYKVRNPETLQLESCVVLCFLDLGNGEHEIMVAETFPKFDTRLKEWIEYANSTIKDNGTPE